MLPPPPPLPLLFHTKQERAEIWLHEDCVVWSNATFIAGRLENIDEVIEDARRTYCGWCQKWGATLACAERNCYLRALHFPCAKELGCYFDEQRLSLYCPAHIDGYIHQRLQSVDNNNTQWPQRYLNFRTFSCSKT